MEEKRKSLVHRAGQLITPASEPALGDTLGHRSSAEKEAHQTRRHREEQQAANAHHARLL